MRMLENVFLLFCPKWKYLVVEGRGKRAEKHIREKPSARNGTVQKC